MSIQQQARMLQSRQRLRSLHRQLSLLSRLSSECKVIKGLRTEQVPHDRVKSHQLKLSYYRPRVDQAPLSLEVREEEILQGYQEGWYSKKSMETGARHLRGSQVRATVYKPLKFSSHDKTLMTCPNFN